MAEFNVLSKKRENVERQVSFFEEYFISVEDLEQTKSIITQLEIRLKKFETYWEEFNLIQSEIEIEHEEEIPLSEVNKRKQFETKYFDLITKAKVFISNYYEKLQLKNDSHSVESSTSNHSNIDSGSQVKLPTIKLPSFSGSFGSWLEFKDSFVALVHQNSNISDIQKYYYLKSALQGEANNIIQSIPVSSANYTIAWDLLCDRFENKRLLVHHHIKAIFDQPIIERESHVKLRHLFDNVNKNLRVLSSLGLKTDEWDTIIIYIIVSKFDSSTRRHWESFEIGNNLATMADMNKFLKGQCEILEQIEINKFENKRVNVNPLHNNNRSKRSNNVYVGTNKTMDYSCLLCKQNHLIYKCDTFLGLDIKDRLNKIKKLGACINCLRKNHLAVNCRSLGCFKCKQKHHTLLHINSNQGASNNAESDLNQGNSFDFQNVNGMQSGIQEYNNGNPSHSHNVIAHTRTDKFRCMQVILSTALVWVQTNTGRFIKCRALLDNASQSSIITTNLCNKLGLNKVKAKSKITGINQISSDVNFEVEIKVQSSDKSFSEIIPVLVIPKITEKLPSVSFDASNVRIPEDLVLADPFYNIKGDIDLLLGASVYWNLIKDGNISLGEDMPCLQLTKLGWIMGGTLSLQSQIHNNYCLITCIELGKLNEQITKFWEVENYSNLKQHLSPTEKYCEEHFEKTVKKDDSGRFIVKIPFKENLSDLGNTRQMALNRLLFMEKRLNKNAYLRKEYNKFLEEYLNLGHMSMVNENAEREKIVCYLPHHPVIKNTSSTTKVRVVFDASAKSDSGISLNDSQLIGPVVQNDLISILLSFRKFSYIISGDIAMMYRQILIDHEQRSLQRILWRFDTDDEVQCYELNTITYGTASAPYLATRCLEQIAMEVEKSNSKIAEIIRNHTYMDDILAGAETKDEILWIQREITKIFSAAGFELRKWQTNALDLLNKFEGPRETVSNFINLGENEACKTLGVYWDSKLDKIKFSLGKFDSNIITKRILLSKISQIFDPLGLLSPLIIIGKLLMQKLWQAQVSWDEPLGKEFYNDWLKFSKNLKDIVHLEIPRQVTSLNAVYYELHGFSDASEKAYGACIYIRTKTHKGFISRLLCSKSRVAPLKNLNLPRLELCGAHLLAKLYEKVLESLNVSFKSVNFWCDSTITLCWIKGSPSRWKTFIANRVSEIQSITNTNDWRHVSSEENPADLISRGTTISDIINSSFWWQGPDWLSLDHNEWPEPKFHYEVHTDVPEAKRNNVVLVTNLEQLDIFARYSSFTKLLRITAYILRFYENCKASSRENPRTVGPLSVNEMDIARNHLIIRAQQEYFKKDYDDLLKNGQLHKKSKLLNLNAFLDKNKILRVGGRIEFSNYSYDKRHPIILSNKHRLTYLILHREHNRLGHCGAQQLLASVREHYWPIQGRNLSKKIIRECLICFRNKPKVVEQLMGNLPKSRITPCPPFFSTGIDYAGPVWIKDKKSRGFKLIKCYLCLFICLSTKAIHIEAVTELTSEAFIAVLRRFTSRRGCPRNIYSDNGSNFIGAAKELNCLFEFLKKWDGKISNDLASDAISWHFIPARSPNFGGIWEANIKRMKIHLNKIVGRAQLTYEELGTVLTQIESILNSRPLVPISDNPNDLEALTPAHFLIGRKLTSVADSNLSEVPTSHLSRFQYMQRLQQQYWQRWSKEYIGELQQRYKWQHPNHTVKVGSLVLLKEENVPPLHWQLGRITSIQPGADGLVRVVIIKTKTGEVKRAVSKICLLPLECSENKIQ